MNQRFQGGPGRIAIRAFGRMGQSAVVGSLSWLPREQQPAPLGTRPAGFPLLASRDNTEYNVFI